MTCQGSAPKLAASRFINLVASDILVAPLWHHLNLRQLEEMFGMLRQVLQYLYCTTHWLVLNWYWIEHIYTCIEPLSIRKSKLHSQDCTNSSKKAEGDEAKNKPTNDGCHLFSGWQRSSSWRRRCSGGWCVGGRRVGGRRTGGYVKAPLPPLSGCVAIVLDALDW